LSRYGNTPTDVTSLLQFFFEKIFVRSNWAFKIGEAIGDLYSINARKMAGMAGIFAFFLKPSPVRGFF
jgi:hypothetical protein